MRCKKHPCDLSSSVGVCSTCLRERLISLIAAQAQSQARLCTGDRRMSDPQPPPLVFPRSVSPYISRRKSDTAVDCSAHDHHFRSTTSHPLFFSTPQVGPSAFEAKKHGRFSMISKLFRSRSHKFAHSGPIPDPITENENPSSWISSFINRGRRCKPSSSGDAATAQFDRPCRRDRGMSPHIEELEEDWEGSPESTNEWKQTPVSRQATMKPSHGRVKPSPNRSNVVAFCLSPLVRVGPHRHWNSSGKGVPPEVGYSGEINRTPAVRPHPPGAASFCKNRSRKLADFGRWNHNR